MFNENERWPLLLNTLSNIAENHPERCGMKWPHESTGKTMSALQFQPSAFPATSIQSEV
jgi:hypothetical protein